MNKNLMIEIFVPTQDGNGHLATGYPVWKNRILTARHVLFPPGRTETSDPIMVRWHHQQGPARDWRPINAIVWEGGDSFDAALLECDFPENANDWGFPSAVKPTEDMRWISEGFPRVGQRDDKSRQAIPMQGRPFSMADAPALFALGVDYAHDIPDGWKGVSGCHVFVDNRIIGVVCSCPKEFGERRLYATPMWCLLQDEDFRRVCGYDIRQERLRPYKANIAKLLRTSVAAMDALDETGSVNKDTDARASALAESLLALSVETLLAKAKQAHISLINNGQEADAAAIRDVAFLVLPAVFDPGVVDALRALRTDIGAALVILPAATPTVAEIIMAGVDRRPVQYQPLPKAQKWPVGALSLPTPPESGRDAGAGALKDWDTHLVNKFALDAQRRGTFTPEAIIKYVADELARESEYGRTWYHFVELPAESAERSLVDGRVRELKRRYPAVVFINLSSDENTLRSEGDLVYWLRLVIHASEE